jgi:short subunit fatty acids transporter
MTLVRILDVLHQNRRLLRWLFICLLVLLIVIDALPMLVDKEHAHTAAEKLPGFWSLFGFASCVLIVFVSKWFGRLGILRREDFYHD